MDRTLSQVSPKPACTIQLLSEVFYSIHWHHHKVVMEPEYQFSIFLFSFFFLFLYTRFTTCGSGPEFPPLWRTKKSRISRYPRNSSRASAAVLETACLNPNDGGEPTPPVPNDDPGPVLPPRLLGWLNRPLKLLRVPMELGLGGLFLILPVIATGDEGAEPTLGTGRSMKPGGALCWRRGAAPLRILTRAPTADPGVLPWKSGESGTFALTTGLPTLPNATNISMIIYTAFKWDGIGTLTALTDDTATRYQQPQRTTICHHDCLLDHYKLHLYKRSIWSNTVRY